MSDIFISYSSKDRAQAEELAERLVCGCNANSAKLPARRAVTTPLGVARL